MAHDRSAGLLHSPADAEQGLDPFAGPFAPDPGLAELLQEASQLLVDWLGDSHRCSPRPNLSLEPPAVPDLQPLGKGQLLTDLRALMGGAYRANHYGALAHLDPPALSVSIAADLVASGLNNNLLAQELSPSLSRLERRLCRWFASRLGLGPAATGVPASGGSLSNLMALVCAREQAGLQGDQRAVVFTGAAAHVSLDKALRVMGLPREALWRLPLDANGRLQPQAVEAALQRAHAEGLRPMALVALAGTTVQGMVDPLGPLAELCRRQGLWLHVDGAIGAVCGLVEGQRWRVAGLEAADSVTINPQKLLGVSKPSSLLLLRDGDLLQRSFATGLPYMEPVEGVQGGELGLQGTRPAEVLKLWLSLRHLGLQGIEQLLSQAFARAERLRQLLTAPQLQVLPGDLHLVSLGLRHSDATAAGAWRERCHQALLQQHFWLSKPDLHGQPLLKAVLGNPFTSEAHLEQLAAIINSTAQESSHE